MKKICSTSLLILTSLLLSAQAVPEGMNYQAVARNMQGEVLANQTLRMRIDLTDGLDGTILYTEFHQVTTDARGLYDLVIGQGEASSGNLSQLPWSDTQLWLETALADPGSGLFFSTQSTQLTTVPYAFHAATAGQAPAGAKSDLCDGICFWLICGNDNIDSTLHFLGTKGYEDLNFRVRDYQLKRVDATPANVIPLNIPDFQFALHVDPYRGKDDTLLIAIGNFDNNYNFLAPRIVNEPIPPDAPVVRVRSLPVTLLLLGISDFPQDTMTIANVYPMRIMADGRVRIEKIDLRELPIFANQIFADQPDSDFDGYPVRVEGGSQGVAIKLNNVLPNPPNSTEPATLSDHNFVSFLDTENGILGSIEGQTLKDLRNSWPYGWTEFKLGTDVGYPASELAANIIDAIIKIFTLQPSQADWGEIISNSIWTAFNAITLSNWKDQQPGNAGVAFQSGGADYAEWLEKQNPEDRLAPGDIVGVRGGKISLVTTGAEQLTVVSRNPVVLGNMPPAERKEEFEKIAFLGQVSVKVTGPVQVGDYILPSGNHDGLGMAVPPARMRVEDYNRVVGTAWSASRNGVLDQINVAVGFRHNLLAEQLIRQNRQKEALQRKLNDVIAYLQTWDEDFPEALAIDSTPETETENQKPIDIDQLLYEHRDQIMEELDKVRKQLREWGIEPGQYPELQEVFRDPLRVIKEAYEGRFPESARFRNESN